MIFFFFQRVRGFTIETRMELNCIELDFLFNYLVSNLHIPSQRFFTHLKQRLGLKIYSLLPLAPRIVIAAISSFPQIGN